MSYQVLARKWRPANFKQMVGQEHVLQALVNALDSDRLHHAYLFSGTRGVGKTTIARIFAKSLNCENGVGSEPCGQCSFCNEVDEGRSVDLIEIDAASRTGVDDMRELLDNVQYAPTRGRFKVYLIDEVHMLSKHSFNALLKTLEEPPPHIKFLLATTDPQKVPVTVLSRCLQFNLKRMSHSQILLHLEFITGEEKIEADAGALSSLARAADGSMRDALSLLDQAIAYGGGQVSEKAVESMLGSISKEFLVKLLDALLSQDASAMIQQARAIIDNNPDFQRICAEMISMLQSIALYQVDKNSVTDLLMNKDSLEKYAKHWSVEEIQLFYQIILQGRQDLLICPDESAGFEMLMLRLFAFSPQPDTTAANIAAPAAADDLKKNTELSSSASAAIISGAPKAAINLATTSPEPAKPSAMGLPKTTAINNTETYPPESMQTFVDEKMDKAALPGTVKSKSAETKPVESSSKVDAFAMNGNAATIEPLSESVAKENQAVEGLPKKQAAKTQLVEGELDCNAWSSMAYELNLQGLALQIVANSVFESYQNNNLKLILVSEIHVLLNPTIQVEILSALRVRLGESLQLNIIAQESKNTVATEQQSPLQARDEQRLQHKLDAIEEIKRQPIVQKLQAVFGAELEESSVCKIERN